MLLPPGKFFSMFHFLEYPFSRGFTHITSPSAYDAPDFDAGFMNDKRDMAPMGKQSFTCRCMTAR